MDLGAWATALMHLPFPAAETLTTYTPTNDPSTCVAMERAWIDWYRSLWLRLFLVRSLPAVAGRLPPAVAAAWLEALAELQKALQDHADANELAGLLSANTTPADDHHVRYTASITSLRSEVEQLAELTSSYKLLRG